MDPTTQQAQLLPGRGVLTRTDDLIALIRGNDPAHEDVVDQFLALCEETLDGSTRLRRAAALVVTNDPGAVPDLGLLILDPDGIRYLLSGSMDLVAETSTGPVKATGVGSMTYTEGALPADLASLRLGVTGVVDPDSLTRFTSGVVRADGLLLGAPEVAQIPEATDTEPEAAFETFDLGFGPPAVEAVLAPEARTVAPAVAAPPSTAGAQVRGVLCSRGHFTNPDQPNCRRCRVALTDAEGATFSGERPVLGVLTLPGGAPHALLRDLVIGRAPEADNEVVAGRADAFELEDPDLALSRVHLKVVLDGWEVRVVDCGSANGSFIADGPEGEWVRLAAHRPTTIVPGTRILLGGQEVSFDDL